MMNNKREQKSVMKSNAKANKKVEENKKDVSALNEFGDEAQVVSPANSVPNASVCS